MFINTSLTVLMVYIIASIVFYGISSYYFSIHSALLRKLLYGLYFLGMTIGIHLGEIDYTDWILLLEFTAMIVFIDLSIYQTPNILKIWNAEFQYADTIVGNAKNNENRIKYMNRKSNAFTNIMQDSEINLRPTMIRTEAEYEDKLNEYLEKYTKQFGFSVHFYFLPDDLTNEKIVKQNIYDGLSHVETLFNVEIDSSSKPNVVDALFDAKVHSFEDEKNAIIPIYGTRYHFLLLVSAKEEAIFEIDTSNIINMVTLFEWSNHNNIVATNTSEMVLNKTDSSTKTVIKSENIRKVTTVPQFNSTKKLLNENKEIRSLVTNR